MPEDPQPYCTGDRCADCEQPPDDDIYGEDDCCEATCGLCPRVRAHDNCFLRSGSDDGKYCDQHGEGCLYPYFRTA
ncbi:hypothetical protein [Streptomyces sp. NPDC060243]|uniref:hypothetical protein n=1 Tax=Streptomyces sp. NPDC060243 TaxID=3347081 RepID=UPI003654390E